MKLVSLFWELFRKFPYLFIIYSVFLIIQGIFAGTAILTIAPIIDVLLHPGMEDISMITKRYIELFNKLNFPVTLFSLLLVYTSFLVLKNLFLLFSHYSMNKIRFMLLREIIKGTFEDFFRARWLFFTKTKQGTLLNTFSKEIASMGDSFFFMGILLANVIQFTVYIAIPIYVEWKSALVCLTLAVIFSFPLFLLSKLSYRFGQQGVAASNRMGTILIENLTAVKVILGFGNQRQNINRYLAAFDDHCSPVIKSQTLNAGTLYIYEPLGISALIIALLIGQSIEIPIAELAVVVWGLKNAVPLVGSFVQNRNQINTLLPSYEQVIKLRQDSRKLEQKSGEKTFNSLKETILFKNMSFAYPSKKNTLVDINLSISRGEMVAIVGESGAGKSTLIDIIMGFHPPDNGAMLIDGIPLEQYDIQSYRKRIGYVPQDVILFNMSIRDNLLWAKDTATEEELWEACRLANAEEFIKNLPEKLDTIVGDRGVRLSGGQCQRLALARAILRKPELLILDEATSALDTNSERLIQQAIDDLMKKTTIVIVAHRLSTIAHADTIYVLKNGKIVEEGNYQLLIKKKGYFSTMAKLQGLDKNTKTLQDVEV